MATTRDGVTITEGMTVRSVTFNCEAEVVRVTEYGDVVIKEIGLLPLTTRGCFLESVA